MWVSVLNVTDQKKEAEIDFMCKTYVKTTSMSEAPLEALLGITSLNITRMQTCARKLMHRIKGILAGDRQALAFTSTPG
jgi:hypothetical protein